MLSTQNKRCAVYLSCNPLQHLLSKFSPKRSTSNAEKLPWYCPPNTKYTQNAQLNSSAAHFRQSAPNTLPSLLPNALPCSHLAFSRRTREHCMGTFIAIFSSLSPLPLLIWMLCLSLQPPCHPFILISSFLSLERYLSTTSLLSGYA